MFEEFYQKYETEEQEVIALIRKCIGAGYHKSDNSDFWEMTVITPVSYTHLDVYKRQTGHRPTRFCFGYNEEDPLCQKLKECLLEQFRILHDEKFVRTFFVGGALGVDMWAGEQLLTLRAQTGYEDIKIIVVIPFIGYDLSLIHIWYQSAENHIA